MHVNIVSLLTYLLTHEHPFLVVQLWTQSQQGASSFHTGWHTRKFLSVRLRSRSLTYWTWKNSYNSSLCLTNLSCIKWLTDRHIQLLYLTPVAAIKGFVKTFQCCFPGLPWPATATGTAAKYYRKQRPWLMSKLTDSQWLWLLLSHEPVLMQSRRTSGTNVSVI